MAPAVAGDASPIPSGPILIGSLLSLSGPVAPNGDTQKLVEQALVNYLNSHYGGIAGHKVKLIIYNDQSSISTGIAGAHTLIADKVSAILYPGILEFDETVPIFAQAHIPVVSLDPGNQWENGTKYPYMFNEFVDNNAAAKEMVHFAKIRGFKKMGVLRDTSAEGEEFAASITTDAKAAGLKLGPTEIYPTSAVDVTPELDQLQASGEQGFFLLGQTGFQYVWPGLNQTGWKAEVIANASAYFDGYPQVASLNTAEKKNTYAQCALAVKKGDALPHGWVAALSAATANGVGVSTGDTSAPLLLDDLLEIKTAIQEAHSLNGTALRGKLDNFRHKVFASGLPITYTAKVHTSWPNKDVYTCALPELTKYDIPIIAPGGTGF